MPPGLAEGEAAAAVDGDDVFGDGVGEGREELAGGEGGDAEGDAEVAVPDAGEEEGDAEDEHEAGEGHGDR